MVEAGVSATAVFTEIPNRQVKAFNIKDANGGVISGAIPLNSRPVLGAGGFQVHARQPFHVASDRFSIGPEATYGLAWGSYSSMAWSLGADASANLLNGNARISGKLGYGGYKIESNASFPETRHGFKLGLEGAFRLLDDLNFVSQAGVTLTPDGPQTVVTFGAQWLFNKRPEPPVVLDGSLGRQSMAVAEQLLDHMDNIYHIPNAMAEVSVGAASSLTDRLLALNSIAMAFISGEGYATLPALDEELAKVQVALDNASNNGIRNNTISPQRRRVREFKERRFMEILKLAQETLDEIEHGQCHKASDLVDSGDPEAAARALTACADNLAIVQSLCTKLDPVLPPIGKVDASTVQRKVACLLRGDECTSDIDTEKIVPAVKKRLKVK